MYFAKLKGVKIIFVILAIIYVHISEIQPAYGQEIMEADTFLTDKGSFDITFIGHASLLINFRHKLIYVDPVMREADYSTMPKADLILVTHHHGDHLDSVAINHLLKKETLLIMPEKSKSLLRIKHKIKTIKAFDKKVLLFARLEAVPAYNIVNLRKTGEPYHAKGEGVGYILTLDNKRIYIAGDTENIPEMKTFNNIDIAFLPMNLPYTMSPEMVADAAITFKPKILYPYHYSKTDTNKIKLLLHDKTEIDVRIRKF